MSNVGGIQGAPQPPQPERLSFPAKLLSVLSGPARKQAASTNASSPATGSVAPPPAQSPPASVPAGSLPAFQQKTNQSFLRLLGKAFSSFIPVKQYATQAQFAVKSLFSSQVTPEQFHDLVDSKKIDNISEEQLNSIPGKLFLENFTAQQFSQLNPATLSYLTKFQMRNIPEGHFKNLTSEQFAKLLEYPDDIAKLNRSQLENIPEDHFKNLTAQQLANIPLNSLSYLNNEQMANIPQDVRSGADYSQLTLPQMKEMLTSGTIAHLTNAQMRQIPPGNFKELTPPQMKAMVTVGIITKITPKQMSKIPSDSLVQLTNDEMAKIPKDIFKGVTSEQFHAMLDSGSLLKLSNDQFQQIPGACFNKVTDKEFQYFISNSLVITPSQTAEVDHAVFDKAWLNGVNLDKLGQINGPKNLGKLIESQDGSRDNTTSEAHHQRDAWTSPDQSVSFATQRKSDGAYGFNDREIADPNDRYCGDHVAIRQYGTGAQMVAVADAAHNTQNSAKAAKATTTTFLNSMNDELQNKPLTSENIKAAIKTSMQNVQKLYRDNPDLEPTTFHFTMLIPKQPVEDPAKYIRISLNIGDTGSFTKKAGEEKPKEDFEHVTSRTPAGFGRHDDFAMQQRETGFHVDEDVTENDVIVIGSDCLTDTHAIYPQVFSDAFPPAGQPGAQTIATNLMDVLNRGRRDLRTPLSQEEREKETQRVDADSKAHWDRETKKLAEPGNNPVYDTLPDDIKKDLQNGNPLTFNSYLNDNPNIAKENETFRKQIADLANNYRENKQPTKTDDSSILVIRIKKPPQLQLAG